MAGTIRACAAVGALLLGLAAGAAAASEPPLPRPTQPLVGMASWYGPGFHGRRTASGDRFDQNGMTAAHRYLPLGTVARITNLANGRQVVVEINDRGPFKGRRVLDLSKGAALRLGMVDSGLARVRIDVLRAPGASTEIAAVDALIERVVVPADGVPVF
jgi:rare lipoprotein A